MSSLLNSMSFQKSQWSSLVRMQKERLSEMQEIRDRQPSFSSADAPPRFHFDF